MRRLVVAVVVFVVGLLATSAGASAATFTVTDQKDAPLANSADIHCVSTDGGACTLRAAVQAADNSGGPNTISLAAGTYKLTIGPSGTLAGSDVNDPAHGDLDVLNADALTITGAGSSKTIIDANELDRAFAIKQGASLSLSGLTIENGNAASQSSGSNNGGGIYADGALGLTADVTMQMNTAANGDGGAIYAEAHATSLSITASTLTDNDSIEGGAIFLNASSATPVTITTSTLSRNASDTNSGGAIYDNASSALTVTGSQFSDNSAAGGSSDGGAIYFNTAAALTVTGSSFAGNHGYSGGAIYDNQATAEAITGTSFIGNDANRGTLYINNSATTTNTLTGDEFDQNRAATYGGAIYWNYGTLAITSSAIIGNRAGTNGGGIYQAASSPFVMTNTTISGNRASFFGGGIDFANLPRLSWANDTIAFNAAQSTEGGGVYGPSGTVPGGTGVINTIVADNAGGDCGRGALDSHFKVGDDAGNNLDSDGTCFGGLGISSDKTSVDPLLSPAAANGGLAKTDALAFGSPAIDTAKASACPATDARGVSRPQGAGCDIGAFEASKPSATITAPLSGAKVAQNAVVKAGYSCSEAGSTALIASCIGPAASGAAIDTTKPGTVTFTVIATDLQGLQVSASVNYTVTPAPPPSTKITSHKVDGTALTIKFKGSGGVGKLHFKCRLGQHGKFRSCQSPKTFTGLSSGNHTVAVEAVDSRGRADPTPAKLHFKIK
jgi:predicted outer membrane repeat protein